MRIRKLQITARRDSVVLLLHHFSKYNFQSDLGQDNLPCAFLSCNRLNDSPSFFLLAWFHVIFNTQETRFLCQGSIQLKCLSMSFSHGFTFRSSEGKRHHNQFFITLKETGKTRLYDKGINLTSYRSCAKSA